MKIRSFTELSDLKTFRERYDYLKLSGEVGASTFGYDRYINQAFYRSTQWKHIRDLVIVRDEGCDLAFPDRPIFGKILIHHMNPISVQDLQEGNPDILNPEYLISVTHMTHNAIHYGDESLLDHGIVERKPGDTKLW